MKQKEITKVLDALIEKKITYDEAKNKLFVLYGVVGQSEQFYCDDEKCNNSKGEVCNGYCKGLSEIPPQ